MSKEIKLPEISESNESATVAEVLVYEGDKVEQEQPLIAVESDKATVEVPAESAGTIEEIKVKKDDEVNTGDVIVIMSENGEDPGDADEDTDEPEKESEDKSEGKKEKPKAKKEESDDAEEEASKDESSEKQSKDDTDQEPQSKKKEHDTTDKDLPAAPLARRLARELDIDIEELSDEGRITSKDVMKYVKEQLKSGGQKQPQAEKPQGIPLPDFSKWGEVERKSMNGIRKATSKSVSLSWSNIPHVTQFDECDVTHSLSHLKDLKEDDRNVSLTALFIKIMAEALKKFPDFNTSLDIEKKEIIHKDYYSVSIAVDTPKGLLMPVIRHVDEKGIEELTTEMKDLVKKAQNQKLDKEDMQGGNIALSNQGVIGGGHFTPIIFPPQVAIVGLGSVQKKPVYNEDSSEFEPRAILPVSVSYDHRVIDGAGAAAFTKWICDAVKNPMNVLIK